MTTSNDPQQNQSFVSGEDRPNVQLNPDTPINELRVRDLSALLGTQTSVKKLELGKEIKSELKIEKVEKFEHKEKPEKFEHKEKPEKFEHKEKPEKFEHKESIKPELGKLEVGERGKTVAAEIPGPGPVETGGDPRVDQLIQSVSSLQQDVADIRNNLTGR